MYDNDKVFPETVAKFWTEATNMLEGINAGRELEKSKYFEALLKTKVKEHMTTGRTMKEQLDSIPLIIIGIINETNIQISEQTREAFMEMAKSRKQKV